jgi:hypothetical protein
MQIRKYLFYFLFSCTLSMLCLACGDLLKKDSNNKKKTSVDKRIPGDWNATDDWSGSEWRVTEE